MQQDRYTHGVVEDKIRIRVSLATQTKKISQNHSWFSFLNKKKSKKSHVGIIIQWYLQEMINYMLLEKEILDSLVQVVNKILLLLRK
jgi:diadenosine tetraphosphate (Ap4A) HIT family hydrolase